MVENKRAVRLQNVILRELNANKAAYQSKNDKTKNNSNVA